ncbi:MAG TPA: SDR family oxidoreductase [Candidatus Krumholzibacteria bacterium]|nr:SDR family oxidoreductase [Candidatus Krumholzibacteria bacterium]
MTRRTPRILVTGATRGIGLACAHALARSGAAVLVHGREDAALAHAVAAELPGGGHEALVFDLEDPRAVAAASAALCADDRGLDCLVNNAGVYEPHPPLLTAAADLAVAWRRHLAVNLDGPALLTLALLEPLRAARGRVVNVTSRGAFRGEPDCPAYGAAKAGLNSFTQSLAVALAPVGVTCFAVAPGWVETDMTREHLAGPAGDGVRAQSPLGRVSTADEVAAAVRFCLLEAPEAMTGAILDVNGASYLRS